MSQFKASRRHFLTTVTLASLALMPLPALADMLPPSRTSGVPVPPGQIEEATSICMHENRVTKI